MLLSLSCPNPSADSSSSLEITAASRVAPGVSTDSEHGRAVTGDVCIIARGVLLAGHSAIGGVRGPISLSLILPLMGLFRLGVAKAWSWCGVMAGLVTSSDTVQ